jgi:peptidoglycan/xylan/chitin deacetylase (PgdA/CDA1 family)
MKITTVHTLLLLTAAFCASAAASEQKQVAITIDDVPFAATTPITVEEAAALNRMILDTLKRHNVKAVGFVNEDRLLIPGKLDAGVAILDEWLDAGMELGNHNFGHVGLWKSSLAESQEAVLKGEVLTRWASVRKGSPFRYYRHPYTQTGKDEDEKQAFEAFLASHGYTVAPFTMEHDDYVFACVYEHVPARGSERDAQRAAVVSEYDAHLRQSVETFEDMSDQLFGRQIPQVFLLHASRLTADTLDRTLSTLGDMGYQFVSLEEALQDDAYRTPTQASRQFGPSWLARWARAKGVKLTSYGQTDPGGSTAKLYEEFCAK